MSDAILCANRILDKIRQPFAVQNRNVFISTSIGILPDLGQYSDPEEVIRDADIAMYRAKSLGKARFEIFDPAMRSSLLARMELEIDLRHALERDELCLHYQPIFSLKTERITGFEALLRWRNPLRGSINPMEFIALAEETGLIIPIGGWVLSQACSQMRQWQQKFPQEPPLTISVNISRKQIEHPDFAGEVNSILESSGLKGDCLRFEITEDMCTERNSVREQCLEELSSLGVRFEIDDFGTGYSSLAYLHAFPISTIKIDRSFVGKIGAGNTHGFIRSIVALAKDLGLDTIAVGVESDVQLACLREYGCTAIQGTLISPAVDESAIARLLTQHTTTPPGERPCPNAPTARLAPAG